MLFQIIKKLDVIGVVYQRSGKRFPFVGLTGESVSCQMALLHHSHNVHATNRHFLRVPRVGYRFHYK